MKRCPQCLFIYPDSDARCDFDNTPLVAVDDAELDAIDHVVYTLHSTFPNPVRTVTDRRTRFRLETAGWGTFTIYARLVGKGRGTEQLLEHELDLRYPEDDAPAPA